MAKGSPDDELNLLSDKEQAQILDEARKEVEDELKARVAADLKRKAKQEILTQKQGERMRGEPVEEVFLDLPSFAQVQGYGKVVLDGKGYDHGRTHKVPASVASVLRDTMAKAWRHEDERKGNTNPVEYNRGGARRMSMGGRA